MQNVAAKKVLVPVVAAIVALGGRGGGFRWWQARQAAPLQGTRIVANGTIEADEVEVGAQRPARLARYDVAEGQSVRQGQVIAVLDTSELSAQMEQTHGAAA